MAALIVTCRICGRDYEPASSDIIAGYAIWSVCPDCRPGALALSDLQKEHAEPDTDT